MPLAFLTHCAAAAPRAAELARGLREHGIDVWTDAEQVRPGTPAARSIARGLQECDVILVLTPSAGAREAWCRPEYAPLLLHADDENLTCILHLWEHDTTMCSGVPARSLTRLPAGPLSDEALANLAASVQSGVFETSLRRIGVATGRYRWSLWCRVVATIPEEFRVSQLGALARLEPWADVRDLYRGMGRAAAGLRMLAGRVVVALREGRFEEDFYGSAYVIPPERIAAANEGLLDSAVSNRLVAEELERLLEPDCPVLDRLGRALHLCVGLAMAEDFLVLHLGAPATPALTSTLRSGWGTGLAKRGARWMDGCGVSDNPTVCYFDEMGVGLVQDVERLASALAAYELDLRRAAGEAA